MKNLYSLLIFLVISISVFAQEPSGYYNSAENKTSAALKTALSSIISANYVDKGYDYLYTIYETSDNLPNGKVWDMYSAKADGTANYYYTHNSNTCGSYNSEGDCYNREHTFCDSWLGAASPQRSDAHHILPTDGYVNNRRSSYPHGKVGSATWTSSNGSKLGSSDASTGYSGTVFEPIDAFKGDFARMYFYVATRYESKIAGWVNNGSANAILDGTSYPAYKSWFYNLMLQWNRLDPVSQKEIDRNNAIYKYQKNRNPFIDHPELAEYIWGNKTGIPWTLNNTSPYLSTPLTGSTVDFDKVAYQQTATKTIAILGANLTGDLTLALSGTNASNFNISTTTITKADVQAGYNLTITYNAITLGKNSAILTITGGGISTVTINLSATATDSFLALAATNITSSGFTANWTSSVNANDYLLNVYSYQGSGIVSTTLLEEDFASGLPSTWTSSGYTDNATSSNMRLASSSNPGSITTSSLDLSTATTLLVRAKQYSNDTGAKLYITSGTDSIAALVTSTANQDFTVTVPELTSSSTLTFYANKGSRVYLDYVKLTTQGSVVTPVSAFGFPKSVGSILNYTVNGLESDSTYYYTVTPQGNGASISDIIRVKTLMNTAVSNKPSLPITWYISGNTLYINDLSENSRLKIYDILGKSVKEISDSKSKEHTTLPHKGIYLIQISKDRTNSTLKVIY
ncbi:Nuclease [uncultured Paludibacter sp.]|uniref:Nuclease n=1 Tax=uncultured Paludibacter sp. TaxID=497635 RepID=A0A653AER7_9BACT|nr:Nuclease [uncultured Paludibacter sp.]